MDDDNQLAKIFRAKLLRAVSNLFEHKYKHSSIVSFFLVKKKKLCWSSIDAIDLMNPKIIRMIG
jgi:hypothetical protein